MSKNRFNVLEYLYYRATILYRNIEGKAGFEANKDRGAWVVMICLYLNFLSIFFIILYSGGDLVRDFRLIYPKAIPIFIIGMGVVMFGLSWYILTCKHHERIFLKYKNETKLQQKTRTRLAILYIVMSFVVLITIGVLGRELIVKV